MRSRNSWHRSRSTRISSSARYSPPPSTPRRSSTRATGCCRTRTSRATRSTPQRRRPVFGPAMRALVQFPTVVDMMCQQIDWTRQLGAPSPPIRRPCSMPCSGCARRLRQVGNLKSTPQQKVETKTESEQDHYRDQARRPAVIYVPQYNPTVDLHDAAAARPGARRPFRHGEHGSRRGRRPPRVRRGVSPSATQ